MELTTSYQLIGSGAKSYVRYRTYAKLNSQSIDNNSSNVNIKMVTYATSSGVSAYPYSFQTSYCTGQSGSGTWYYSTSEEIVIEQEVTFTHNEDGTLSVSGTSVGVGGGVYDASYSWSFSLPSIPRASVPTMSTNDIIVNGTGSTIIYTNRKTAYYHKIEYVFGSLTGVIGTGVETQISWTPTTALLAQIPNSKSGTGTIKCTTYKEQACTTQVGTPQTCSYTLRTDEAICVPTISGVTLTEQDAKALAVETAGQFIRYVSDILVGGTVTPNYYATLASVKVVCGAFTYTASSTIAISITDITDNSIKIVATDSRGYQTTVTTDFILIQYVKPTVINTSYRQTATDGKIILKSEGGYFTGSLGQVDNAYTMTYKYRQKVGGTWAEYTTGTTALTLSASGTSYSIEQLLGETFDYRYPCELVITLADKLVTATGTKVISQGIPIDSKGLLPSPHFDIYGDLKLHDPIDPTKKGSLSLGDDGAGDALTSDIGIQASRITTSGNYWGAGNITLKGSLIFYYDGAFHEITPEMMANIVFALKGD